MNAWNIYSSRQATPKLNLEMVSFVAVWHALESFAESLWYSADDEMPMNKRPHRSAVNGGQRKTVRQSLIDLELLQILLTEGSMQQCQESSIAGYLKSTNGA